MHIGDRVKELRTRNRMTRETFAAELEEKPSKIQDIETGRQRVNDEFVMKLVGRFPIDLNWLYSGINEATKTEDLAVSEKDFFLVPRFDAEVSAGHGSHGNGDDPIEHLAFRKDWLRRVGVSIRSAALARAKGDSMLPVIHDGDMLLINMALKDVPSRVRASNDTRPATIYALRDDCGARVKRIERIAPGQLMLLSDNPAFPPEVKADSEVSILGKVVWWGHTHRDR